MLENKKYKGPPLLIWPDPRLSMVCDPFDFETARKAPDACDREWYPDLWDILDHLWAKADELMGYGLAAPQLGWPTRAFVIHVPGGCKIEIVNPTLYPMKRKGHFMSDEGCLSYPGKRVIVRRWSRVKVKGFDRYGDPVSFGGNMTQAATLQHEIEHLDGINLADHAGDNWATQGEQRQLARARPAGVEG